MLGLASQRERPEDTLQWAVLHERDARAIGRRHPVIESSGVNIEREHFARLALHGVKRGDRNLLSLFAGLGHEAKIHGHSRAGKVAQTRPLHSKLWGFAARTHPHD